MQTALKWVSLVGKVVGVLLMLDWQSISPKWGIGAFVGASVLKDVVNRIGDYLDNQKMDGSYKG